MNHVTAARTRLTAPSLVQELPNRANSLRSKKHAAQRKIRITPLPFALLQMRSKVEGSANYRLINHCFVADVIGALPDLQTVVVRYRSLTNNVWICLCIGALFSVLQIHRFSLCIVFRTVDTCGCRLCEFRVRQRECVKSRAYSAQIVNTLKMLRLRCICM